MIKLAINSRFLTRALTGVDRVAIEMVNALARRDDVDEVTLLHPAGSRPLLEWTDALPHDASRKLKPVVVGSLRGHLWEQVELPLAMRDRTLLSFCSTGPILRNNHIVMIHDAQVWDAPHSYSRAFRMGYRALLPALARTAKHVLTVSHHSAFRLEALRIAPKGKVRVVYNGADHILRVPSRSGTLTKFGLSPNGYILAIGSLAPHKNIRLLIDACVARNGDAPPLVICGGSNPRIFADDSLRQIDAVRYIGRVNDGELRALYEGALALAFPSLTEGFGLPPLEAMLCGCPVVATTGGAVPEICGDAALYADPRESSAWTSALERIVYDFELRNELVGRGRARASRYTWDAAAGALIEVLY
jgi:glycosyltransferase involved in cell wall biosynthesis